MNCKRNALLAAAVVGLVAATSAQAQNRIFYIDYDHGNDKADGRSPATAWQHAPGDSQNTGSARYLTLLPGDQLRFKGGVRYRGRIGPTVQGTKEAPVIFDGSSWGDTRAIFDGSEPLSGVRPCQSANDCLGSPYWQNLWRANLPATASWTDYLFVNDQIFQLAQYPSLPKEQVDDISKYVPIPRAELARLQAGRIQQPIAAGFARGTPVLALWVQPNLIGLTEDIRVSPSGIDFAGAKWLNSGFKPYTDRDNKFSLMNLPDQVNRPGLFASSPKDGVAIFWPIPAGAKTPKSAVPAPSVSIGGRRTSINTSNSTYLTIRGFSFTSYAGIPGNVTTGAAIRSSTSKPGLTISDNSFRSFANIGGPAVIQILLTTDLRIERNQISDVAWTRGVVIDNSKGPVFVRCNELSDIESTGIRFLNVRDGTIAGNKLARLRGVHGNGITAYLDLRNVKIVGNVVTDTARPVTVHGIGSGAPYFSEGTPGVSITDNVLMGGDGVNGAVTSYGSTPNLVIRNNFLYSIPYALKISGTETGVAAEGNQLVGKLLQPKASSLISPADNVFHDPEGNGSLLLRQMQRMQPEAGYCS